MDEMQVNGAMKMHWKRGKEEVKQILAQCVEVLGKANERRWCAQCGKDKTHVFCTIYHHYFHNNPKFLLAGGEKLIATPTGKRYRNGQPVYGPMVQNTCFHVWHAKGREEAWAQAGADCLSGVNSVRDDSEESLVVVSNGDSVVSTPESECDSAGKGEEGVVS